MNVMSLDIELNNLNKKPKVIEIGAVVIKTETGEVVEMFHTYVNPKELITEYITNLTGITNNVMETPHPDITEAYYLLKEFHKRRECLMNPIVWGSSTRNDSNSIWQEACVEEDNFMGHRVIDAKTLYQSHKMKTNGKVRGGLETACKDLGLGWSSTYGEPHRALADAYNTARVWDFLVSKMK